MAKFIPRIVFDFDGVINSYKSGWCGVDNIPDPPVPGIREAIQELMDAGYEVVVSSSRATGTLGLHAIQQYLEKHDIRVSYVSGDKPPALCYIDDRAICFDGNAAGLLEKVQSFKPWYERREANGREGTGAV